MKSQLICQSSPENKSVNIDWSFFSSIFKCNHNSDLTSFSKKFGCAKLQ